MQVTPSTFTVVEYCEQMDSNKIVVNREYQRSNKVWPPAAKSYLIDTILLGFPIPKLCLYQVTDLKTRKTVKEIVDGQQRSQTILSFFHDDFRITGKGEFSGRKFSQLNDEDQITFLSYQLSTDIFVGATNDEIRQVFRRINSYTIPLNPQEKRHATFQGAFKWFMVDLSGKYAQVLKDIGVFSESNLTRMADVSLLTEVIMTMFDGMKSASEVLIDKFYSRYDSHFDEAADVANQIDLAFERVFSWPDIHKGPLMRPYNFYTLMLAILHKLRPIPSLSGLYSFENNIFDDQIILTNLSTLSAALDQPTEYKKFETFIAACSSATTRVNQRTVRFQYFCRALEPVLM